jgi:hypothetical protein
VHGSITYFDDEPNRDFNLRKEEARWLAVAISRLPELLGKEQNWGESLSDGARDLFRVRGRLLALAFVNVLRVDLAELSQDRFRVCCLSFIAQCAAHVLPP